jgi:uncharacterized membrane protein
MAQSIVRPISIARHPITSILLPIPIICFAGALLTDLVYVNSSGNLMWVNFSSWLITAGLVFGALAILVLLIEGFRRASSWLTFALIAAAWIVELLNALIHARDGWTAVAPLGMTLSILGTLLALAGGWLSRSTPRLATEYVR